MGNFFCKLFAPWKAESLFDDPDNFYDFLLRRNKTLNAVRVLYFAVAAVCRLLGYAFQPQPYNTVAVCALVLALGLSLVIQQNEKQLPSELQSKNS